MTSALVLALVAGCDDRRERNTAKISATGDTLGYSTECGPCACSDDACYDSLVRANDQRSDSIERLDRRDAVRSLMAAPKPNISSFAAVAQAYSADTSLYRVKYALNKGVLAGDTVYLRLRRDSAQGIRPLNILRKSIRQRDSADFKVDKIFGQTARYTAIAQYRRAGQIIANKSVNWTTNFAPAVDTTPPVIDTLVVDSTLAIMKLDVKPDSVKLLTSHDATGKLRPLSERSQQFCPLIMFADGKVALPTPYKSLSVCTGEHNKFSVLARAVSPKQQARADSLCIKWSATGGTITATPCEGVPS